MGIGRAMPPKSVARRIRVITTQGASVGAVGSGGDGVSTAAWFFVLWHGSFAVSVVVYTLLKDADDTASVSHVSTATAIAVALACTFVATAAFTWLVTLGAGYMPAIYVGTIQQTQFARNLNIFLLSLSIVAFVLLFFRRRTVLDTWLIVILLASWPNFLVAIFLPPFGLAWAGTRHALLP